MPGVRWWRCEIWCRLYKSSRIKHGFIIDVGRLLHETQDCFRRSHAIEGCYWHIVDVNICTLPVLIYICIWITDCILQILLYSFKHISICIEPTTVFRCSWNLCLSIPNDLMKIVRCTLQTWVGYLNVHSTS